MRRGELANALLLLQVEDAPTSPQTETNLALTSPLLKQNKPFVLLLLTFINS